MFEGIEIEFDNGLTVSVIRLELPRGTMYEVQVIRTFTSEPYESESLGLDEDGISRVGGPVGLGRFLAEVAQEEV